MARFESKPLAWLDQLAALKARLQANPNAGRSELRDALDMGDSYYSDLLTIKACIDPAAEEKIRQAAKGDKPYILSFRNARALAGLSKAKLDDLPTTFHAALDTTLSRRLKTNKIEALVKSLVEGKGDKPTAKDENRETPGSNGSPKRLELLEKVKAEIIRGDGQTTYQDELAALLASGPRLQVEEHELSVPISDKQKIGNKGNAENEKNENSGKKGKAGKKSKVSSDKPSWFWEWMVGIKFFSQLKSKVKKGQDLTMTEKWVVVLYKIYKIVEPPFKFIGKHLGKLFAESVKGLWHSFKQACGKTFTRILEWAIPILIICALVWGLGKVYQWVIVNPLHWIESEVKSGFHWGGSKTEESAAPTSVPITSSIPPQIQSVIHKTSEKKIEKTAPTITYQPAVSFAPNPASTQTLYDPKILDFEIKSLPGNYVVVKDYPLTPDEGMPVDVAVSRMQDITDPDKYTMMIGSGKQIISSVNPTNTTLTIQYKSADPFGLFGGGNGVMNFLWEDVKYIHANEIETVRSSELGSSQLKTSNSSLLTSNSRDVIYQCSLVVSGSKYPLTIQCATADDLEHLVSTMQYFIRHSRLAHDTALGGMPYLYQGLMLNGDSVVEKLWANSPADKAGLVLGDHLWSIGKITGNSQEKKDLEKGLSSLPVTLFAASDTDWVKANIAKNSGMTQDFRPKLRKVILLTD